MKFEPQKLELAGLQARKKCRNMYNCLSFRFIMKLFSQKNATPLKDTFETSQPSWLSLIFSEITSVLFAC